MSKSLSMVWVEPVSAYQSMVHELWPWAKPRLIAGGKVTINASTWEDDRTLRQNRFYWSGACLGAIADQAKVAGIRYDAQAWHNLFKRQFLGFEVVKERVAGERRLRVIRRMRSTSALKLRAMGVYLEQVQAYAATELGVMFDVANWQEWVDPQTGEITRTDQSLPLLRTASIK